MTIGVALIGCGYIAREHLCAYESLSASGRHRVRVVVDPLLERAETLGREFGVEHVVATLEEALDLPDVTAVDICTPTTSHTNLALTAIAAGRHVLVEKPIALTLNDADAIVDAAESSAVTTMVAHSARFDAVGRRVNELKARATLGRIGLIECTSWYGYFWGGGWRAWQIDPKRSGGNIVHNGIHDIDLMCSIIGAAPTKVFARGTYLSSPDLGAFDHFHVLLDFPAGERAMTTLSYSVVPPGTSLRTIHVSGDRGEAGYDSSKDEIIWRAGGAQLPVLGGGDPYRFEIDHWLDCIETGRTPTVTPRQARIALEVAHAAESSARSGEAVTLEEQSYA